MSLPETCPFCGAGVRAVKDGDQRWVEFECFSEIGEKSGEFRYRSPICRHAELNAAKDRVAELEARTHEAEESNANALASLSAAEARIELRRVENEAVRRQLGHAENACDAMEKRVAELEAREKQAREDEAWAKQNLAYVSMGEDGCWAGIYDRDASEERGLVERVDTIADALSALRDMVEGGAR